MREMEVIINGTRYVPAIEAPQGIGLEDALEVRFDSDAGDGLTVREYLKALLTTLWREGEEFSGKRPFGNSDWEYQLYAPLIKHGFIDGELDEDGYVNYVDKSAHDYVANLIEEVFRNDD
jgi:hypothetical protein